MHHYLEHDPLVKFGEGRFEISLTNSLSGELVTVFGTQEALVNGRDGELSYEDIYALGRYLADCLSRWEGQDSSGETY